MTGVLPIRCKTLSDQSIRQSITMARINNKKMGITRFTWINWPLTELGTFFTFVHIGEGAEIN